MKNLIKIVITSAFVLGLNVMASGASAFGGTGFKAADTTVIMASGASAFGGVS